MPILNRADFHTNVKRMLDYQTLQPDQVILVEEQSSYDAHGSPIPNVEYVLCPETHVSCTNKKTRGMAKATGDLIVGMGSDDWYSPNWLATWVRLFEASGANIMRHQSQWVYNIVDRRYGLVKDVSGGQAAYMREWALAEYNNSENTLNRIEMPRTNAMLGHFLVIRHSPAGEPRADGFRRCMKLLGRGNTCGSEYTPSLDPDATWFRNYINHNTITDFYLDYGEHARLEYPCAPS